MPGFGILHAGHLHGSWLGWPNASCQPPVRPAVSVLWGRLYSIRPAILSRASNIRVRLHKSTASRVDADFSSTPKQDLTCHFLSHRIHREPVSPRLNFSVCLAGFFACTSWLERQVIPGSPQQAQYIHFKRSNSRPQIEGRGRRK